MNTTPFLSSAAPPMSLMGERPLLGRLLFSGRPSFLCSPKTAHLAGRKARIFTGLRDRGNQLPWFWCELDCTPLKKGWLDTLETEYRMTAESHPFMGVREQTRVTNASGELVDGGSHMAGTGVYPPNVHVFSHLWLFVHKMTTAFDIVIQWEIAPVLKTTTLIQHAFRTHGYTRGKDGVICGEDRNNFPSGIRFDKPLSPDAVIHHGCQDGSLARLFFGPADDTAAPSEAKVLTQLELPISSVTPRRRVKIPTVDETPEE